MEPITVAVRIRPPKYDELVGTNKQNIVALKKDEHTLHIKKTTKTFDNRTKHSIDEFKFDHVYSGTTPQSIIYDDLGRIIVDKAVSGINCCLFAYGQTSSGKTHTMLGQDIDEVDKDNTFAFKKGQIFDSLKPLFFILPYDMIYSIHEFIGVDSMNSLGIIPRVVKDLFTSLKRYSYFRVSCRFLEIYNEKICNLLTTTSSSKKKYVDFGANSLDSSSAKQITQIRNWKDASKLINIGFSNRSTRATAMNDVSSRSHAVFTIFIEFQPDRNHATKINSQVNLVDLAGSEKTGQIAKSKDERDEGTAINTSLLHLGRVINKLADISEKVSKIKDHSEAVELIKSKHVPFRDSVLTTLLESTLGGKAKTIMIATCSPVEKNVNETLSTLRYASRAAVIKSCSEKNEEELFDEQLKKLVIEAITTRMNYKKVKLRMVQKKIYKDNRVNALRSPEYLVAKSELLTSYNGLIVYLNSKADMFGRKQVEEVYERVKSGLQKGAVTMQQKVLDATLYMKALTSVCSLSIFN